MSNRGVVVLENADGSREAWRDGHAWCGGTTCADAETMACDYHRRGRRRLLGSRRSA